MLKSHIGDPRRHYQLVAERIRTLIEVDRIKVGARLPAERDLALQFGVSRQSVREALIALEIDGRVEIRGGSGVYVCPECVSDVAPRPIGTPAELMNARVALECTVITLAAARVDQRSLQRVGEALDAMRDDLACGRRPLDADRQFHLSIAEMSGSAVLASFVATLFDSLRGAIRTSVGRRIESAQVWHAALAEHEAIYRALEARNPVAASAALCSHLLASLGRCTAEPADPLTHLMAGAGVPHPLRSERTTGDSVL